jgi:hypothetical protein
MEIKRAGSRPSQKAPAEHFTGTVRLDPLFQAVEPGRVSGAYVTFEPCARSDWHTHPLGQTLIVTAGCGLHQRRGGPIEGGHDTMGEAPSNGVIAIEETYDVSANVFSPVDQRKKAPPVIALEPRTLELVRWHRRYLTRRNHPRHQDRALVPVRGRYPAGRQRPAQRRLARGAGDGRDRCTASGTASMTSPGSKVCPMRS